MEELIELLQQIQDLAGVGIEALQNAAADGGGEGAPPAEGEPPAEPPAEGEPPAEEPA